MNPDQVLDQIIQANPKPAEGQAPGTVLTRAALLVELDRRSGDMQTQDKPASQKTTRDKPATKPTKPTSPSRQRRLVPALAGAAAVMVALVIGVVLLSSESDTATSAPVSVVVPGTEQWTDTGIDLSVDDTVLIEADGAVTPSKAREPLYGPDGVPDRAVSSGVQPGRARGGESQQLDRADRRSRGTIPGRQPASVQSRHGGAPLPWERARLMTAGSGHNGHGGSPTTITVSGRGGRLRRVGDADPTRAINAVASKETSSSNTTAGAAGRRQRQ